MASFLSLFFLVSLLNLKVLAVDMYMYQPSSEVESGFEGFLQEYSHPVPSNIGLADNLSCSLYAETEDAIATTSFTNFFIPQGALIVLGHKAVGAAEIVAFKEHLMPIDGLKIWNHVPNITTVYSETETNKTYAVEGVIESTYVNGNCSQA